MARGTINGDQSVLGEISGSGDLGSFHRPSQPSRM